MGDREQGGAHCRAKQVVDFTAHEDQRPRSETVYQGPTFHEWATENKDALIAALNK